MGVASNLVVYPDSSRDWKNCLTSPPTGVGSLLLKWEE